MNGVKIVLLVALACGLSFGVLWMQAESTEAVDPFTLDTSDRTIFAPGLVSSEQAILDGIPGASVYRIDLNVPSFAGPISAHQDITYTNTEDVELGEIWFHLYPNVAGGSISIEGLTVDGEPVDPIYDYEGHAMRIPLAAPLLPGEAVVIAMEFELEIPFEYMAWGPFGVVEGVLSLDQFYPVIPVYDDEGWNIGYAPLWGDWSYYDLSFYIVRVDAPASWKVATTGSITDHQTSVLRQSATYIAGPVRDFYLAASPRYEIVREVIGEVTLGHYVFPGGEGQAREAITIAKEALETFERRYGAYPYTELDFASTSMGGGAMEYPGIVAMSHELYDPDAMVWGFPSMVMLTSTMTHEIAHQWFYNVVGSDQIDEPWLDEGMAQYSVNTYFIDTSGISSARSYRGSWTERMNRLDDVTLPIGLPSTAYERPEYSPIIYGRAPFFILELEDHLDAEAFLRAYYEDHKWGIATTESFLALAQEHAEEDLTDLFDAWIYGDN